MRNLKKLLALVLAMVMAFSLMLSASAVDYKDYPDKDSITEEFDEAVRVLTGLKVMQGDEKGFRPGDTITRAEAAAIIYRIATGDVDDNQVKIYADYGTFTDVKHDDWFAGYVGYCQNAGYIKGTTPTTFNPYGKVTGYEALAMILRVVGYGKNNEFTGGQWQVNVASLSKELGVTDNVKNANFETTLNFAARRDVVADLMFQTLAFVPTVTYTPALSYNDKVSLTGSEFNPTLGQKIFGLWKGYLVNDEKEEIVDMWGRPGYYWLKDGTKQGVDSTTHKPIYRTYDANGNISFGTETSPYVFSKMVAVITEKPALTYTKTIRECDLAHDFPFSNSKNFSLYVNSDEPITTAYHVEATDTVTKVGGQGRLVEVYKKGDNHDEDRVVMIDTYLAQVTKVTTAVLDPQGHVVVPAQLTVNVYDDTSAKNTPNDHVIVKGLTSAENWEYAAGDYLLVNAWTDWREGDAANEDGADALNHNPTTSTNITASGTAFDPAGILERQNKAAFEPNIVDSFDGGGISEVLVIDATAQIVGKAESFNAAQTSVTWNTGKHNVGDKEYNDAMLFYLDEAQRTTGTNFAWFLDQYGNLIGAADIGVVNFGVITSIYSSFGQGDASTDGTAKAIAKVKLADGTETEMTISRFMLSSADTLADGHGTAGADLVTTATTGRYTANLVPMYDYNGTAGQLMKAEASSINTKPARNENATLYGVLYVSPVASLNTSEEYTGADGNNADPYFGIVKGNMFKFVPNSNGTMTAVEVAGNGTNSGAATFSKLANAQAGGANRQGKLIKSLGFVASHDGEAGAATVWVDNDTKIMLRNSSASGRAQIASNATITCYDGLDKLPGDVNLVLDSEIDWADTDNDGRAEYLYITGSTSGSVTYGLFYFNRGTAVWNGNSSTGNGTIEGWLDGEAYTAKFDNYSQFTTVRRSQDEYAAHLFGLQITDGVVSNVMVRAENDDQPYLLFDYTPGTDASTDGFALSEFSGSDASTAWTNSDGISLAGASAADKDTENGKFHVGTLAGNPYSVRSVAAYWNDDESGTNGANVTYNDNTGVISRGGYDFQVTPNTKIIGLGGGTTVTEGTAALYYLNRSSRNDVTIIYENNTALSIVAIYIATDPNVTPVGPADNTVSYTMSIDGSRFVVTHRVGGAATPISTTVDTYLPYRVYLSDGTRVPYDVLNNGGYLAIAANQDNGGFGLDGLSSGRYYIEVDAEGKTWTSPVFFK